MTPLIVFILIMSVSLTVGRNIASKKISAISGKRSQFFFSQMVLFGVSAVLLLALGIKNITAIATETVIFGLIYGMFLISSQWMLTLAMGLGTTSVCSVVYAMGFILPTASGALFWDEDFTFINAIGTALAVVIILLSAKSGDKKEKISKAFIPFIVIAMLSSGGLGIMQKVQQSGSAPQQKEQFLLIGFLVAFLCSLAAFLFSRVKTKPNFPAVAFPALAGLCFGGANLCNTILAGKMKSAVFFPLQNISTVLLSAVLGIILFKEKLTIKTVIILLLGAAVILLFSF